MALPAVSMECRAVADPELRFAPSGVAVCKVRTVSSSRKKNEAGEWVDDKVCWLNVTCFKQLAEHVAESIKKGDLLTVTGRIMTDEWTTAEGEKRSQIVLTADSVAASLAFRTLSHGQAGTARVERTSGPVADDPWATPAAQGDDQPPF